MIKILGVPYEEGTYWRKGSKAGPARVREHLYKLRELSVHSKQSLQRSLRESDAGDLAVNVYDKDVALRQIEDGAHSHLEQASDCFLIAVGGDHSITLPLVRAHARRFGKGSFGIIQLDAHSDTFADIDGYRFHHGATFRNIIEEGLVAPEHLIQIGIRGQVREGGLSFQEHHGNPFITMDQFRRDPEFSLRKHTKSNFPYYLSLDIDVVDPAFAPGTGVPVPGGLSSHEVISLVRECAGLTLVGADVVEIAPAYDPADITSLLGAYLVYEIALAVQISRAH